LQHKQEDQSIPKVHAVTINDLLHGNNTLLGPIWADVLPGTPNQIVPYLPPPPTLHPLG